MIKGGLTLNNSVWKGWKYGVEQIEWAEVEVVIVMVVDRAVVRA